MAAWFEDYNEMRPHKGLRMLSTRNSSALQQLRGVRFSGGNSTVISGASEMTDLLISCGHQLFRCSESKSQI